MYLVTLTFEKVERFRHFIWVRGYLIPLDDVFSCTLDYKSQAGATFSMGSGVPLPLDDTLSRMNATKRMGKGENEGGEGVLAGGIRLREGDFHLLENNL